MKRLLFLACLSFSFLCHAQRVIPFGELDLRTMSCGHERPQVDKSNDGNPIRIGSRTFAHGLSTHAPSRLEVPLGGNALSFEAWVGVDAEVPPEPACVEFRVWADGKFLCSSGLMKRGDGAKLLKGNLRNVDSVVFEVTDGANGRKCDHADWADARIVFKDGTGPVPAEKLTSQLGILTPPVSSAPRINGARVYGVRPGHPVLFRVPVTGEAPLEVTVDGLPAGLSYAPETRILSGSLEKAGDYPMVFRAKNAKGVAERRFTIRAGETIALTPPMGWNSWNAFFGNVSDSVMRAQADAMISSGLADHGYVYINADSWWQVNNNRQAEKNPEMHGEARNPDGTFRPNSKFPDMKALTGYLHAKGLKAGLYSSPGPFSCGGCEASWQHEYLDAKTFADWNFDYLKYDWCSYETLHWGPSDRMRRMLPYLLMGQALRVQNRDIVLSMSQYGLGDPSSWGAQTGAQCWRTTGDVYDNWPAISASIEQQKDLWYFTKPGAWNDPDMLCVGPMHRWSKDPRSRLTPNEQYTHISMWCMVGAPLLLGCDLEKIAADPFAMNLVANDEVLEIDQDERGAGAAKIYQGKFEIWAKPLADGSFALAIFNSGIIEKSCSVPFAECGLLGAWTFRDLWRQKDEGVFTGSYTVTVPGHATHLVRIRPAKDGRLDPRLTDIRNLSWQRILEEKRPLIPGITAPNSPLPKEARSASVYPVPEEMRSTNWAVRVNGSACGVSSASTKYHNAYDPGGEYAFASFEMSRPVRLEVKTLLPRDLSHVNVRPPSAPVTWRRQGDDTLALEIGAPCNFTIEPDETRKCPLFIFVNAPETNTPDLSDPRVKVMEPGIHRVPKDILYLSAGETLYLKPGAVLQAAIRASGDGIRICGRGVIDGSRWAHKKGPQYAFLMFKNCKRLLLEDFTVRGSYHWTIMPDNCDGVTLRNVKLCGGRCGNDDGIDPCNTRDLLLTGCFFRTEDDCVAVKGMNAAYGACENITITNSVFWCDFARIMLLGHESRASRMRNIRFEDCDVLHYVRPLFLLEPGEDMTLSDVFIRNVRVWTDTYPRTEETMRIQPVVNNYMHKRVPGRIRDVRIEDIAIVGPQTKLPLKILLAGVDEAHRTENVTLRNITFNGEKILQGNPIYKIKPFVEGLQLDSK